MVLLDLPVPNVQTLLIIYSNFYLESPPPSLWVPQGGNRQNRYLGAVPNVNPTLVSLLLVYFAMDVYVKRCMQHNM